MRRGAIHSGMRCVHLRSLTGRQGMECPARVLLREHEITLPLRMAQEFCALVSMAAQDAQWEPSHQAIWSLFCDEYLADDDYHEYVAEVFGVEGPNPIQLALKVRYGGQGALCEARGDLIRVPTF